MKWNLKDSRFFIILHKIWFLLLGSKRVTQGGNSFISDKGESQETCNRPMAHCMAMINCPLGWNG